MSQSGIVDLEAANPQVPTQFDADIGFAIPIANTLEILGDTSLAGSTPVHTEGSGNTITTYVQVSQDIASTDVTKVGLAAFDSSMFTVDANGFVQLAGGSVGIDSLTGDDGVVVSGDASGNINLVGFVVANATNPKPLYVDGDAGTFTQSLELQVASAIAAAPGDTNDAGICSFDNSSFSVSTNGFVQLIGGGDAIEQFTLDDTNIVTPSSGNVNMFGQDTPNQNGLETYQISADEIGLRMASPFTLEDFTFSTATAATTRTVSVINSDNTSTSSNSTLNIEVGGASGGDPYTRYTVGAARSFAVGIDNTDSDKYKWVTAADATATPSSGTQIMEMSTAGDGVIAGSWTVDNLKLDSATLSRINAGAITLQPQPNSNLFFDTVLVNHGYDNAGGLTQSILQNNSATAGSRVQHDAAFANSTGKAAYSAIYSGAPRAYIWGIDAADSSRFKLGTEASATPTLDGSTAIILATTTGALTFPASTASFTGGNVDVTRSNSGGTVSATISNTDNTNASSDSAVIASVGGTSGGEAYFSASKGSTVTWSQGLKAGAGTSYFFSTAAASSTTPDSGTQIVAININGSTTISGQANGSTTNMLMENVNNTASSSVNLALKSAGSTAGDAWIRFQISGAGEYSLGNDNSDSDSLCITNTSTLNGTNYLRMSSAGEINYPFQPAFQATNSATDTNQTGAGTNVTVQFNTEVLDQNGDYDNATYTFTAPRTAFYNLSAIVMVGSLTTLMTLAQFKIVTTARTYYQELNPGAVKSSSDRYTFVLATDTYMTAGDTATVQLNISNGIGDTASILGTTNFTVFSGYMLC